MVVYDEETLQQAMTFDLPVRFIDRYVFIDFASAAMLEHNIRRALNRGEIAIVVPLEQEHTAENFTVEFRKFKERRRQEEIEGTRAYLREHPELTARWQKHLRKKGRL